MRYPIQLATLALSGCAVHTSSTNDPPIWLDYAESVRVPYEDVSRYQCRQGVLSVERVTIRERRLTCEVDPAFLR